MLKIASQKSHKLTRNSVIDFRYQIKVVVIKTETRARISAKDITTSIIIILAGNINFFFYCFNWLINSNVYFVLLREMWSTVLPPDSKDIYTAILGISKADRLDQGTYTCKVQEINIIFKEVF